MNLEFNWLDLQGGKRPPALANFADDAKPLWRALLNGLYGIVVPRGTQAKVCRRRVLLAATFVAALVPNASKAGNEISITYTEDTQGQAEYVRSSGPNALNLAMQACRDFVAAHPAVPGFQPLTLGQCDGGSTTLGWVCTRANIGGGCDYFWFLDLKWCAGNQEYTYAANHNIGSCLPVRDRYPARPLNGCPADPHTPHPIYPLTGTKRKDITSPVAIGGLTLHIAYDSARAPWTAANQSLGEIVVNGNLGPLWWSTFHRALVISTVGDSLQAARGDGNIVSFVKQAGVWTGPADARDTLTAISGGYLYKDQTAVAMEAYSATGSLSQWQSATGMRLNFTYSTSSTPPSQAPGPGYLIGVNDPFGRTLSFTYTTAATGNVVLASVVDVLGQPWTFGYDANANLTAFNGPGSTAGLGFIYDSPNPAQSWALTGLVDENGIRTQTYAYNAQGQAVSSEQAGGVNSYTVNYPQAPQVQIVETYDATNNVVWRDHAWVVPQPPIITSPTGAVISFNAPNTSQRYPRSAGATQPAGSGCSASTSALTYDANGNIASADDFNGHRTCYLSDLTRNLETTRVEGLPNTQACSTVTPPNAALPANSRKTSTQWHPDWRLSAKVAEPGHLTTNVYNGQPDPFNGNAIASCAPTTALLLDGKPIAVLCREVEQATTDTDGHLGFGAALQAGVPKREQTWTYNQFGQVLTHDGPRTDVTDTTTYVYYADTTADHTRGDPQRVTNALGQMTNFTKYNKHGQLLQSSDPNGITTTHTYDLRQRLLSTSVAGQTTSYAYDPVGQLTRIIQPDASWIGYAYDPAHRLVAVTDNQGNRIDYTLDNAGNRIAENTKDPSGTLKRALSRSLDALGRVQQTTGRE